MKKSLLSLIMRCVGVAVCCHVACIAAVAADFCSGGLCYDVLADGTVAVVRQPADDHPLAPSLYGGVVIVPQSVYYDGENRTVVAVADSAFYRSAVTEVQLPATVTHIGRAAFAGSARLEGITLPLHLRSLAPYALAGTAVRAVALPDGLTEVGHGAFADCASLHTLVLPASLRHIGNAAFDGCYALFEIYCAAVAPPTAHDGTFFGASGVDIILPDEQATDRYADDLTFGNPDVFSLWAADDFSATVDNAAFTWADNWLCQPLGNDLAYKIYGEDGYLMAITAAKHYYFAYGDHAEEHLIVPSTLINDSDEPFALTIQPVASPAEVQPALVERPQIPYVWVSGSAIHVQGQNTDEWITVFDVFGRCRWHQPAMLNVIDGLERNQIYIVVVGNHVTKVAL